MGCSRSGRTGPSGLLRSRGPGTQRQSSAPAGLRLIGHALIEALIGAPPHLGVSMRDYWLFDDRFLGRFHQDGSTSLSMEPRDDPEEVRAACRVREAAWPLAHPRARPAVRDGRAVRGKPGQDSGEMGVGRAIVEVAWAMFSGPFCGGQMPRS
ncbi:DUF6879 family protein [Streptomyces sp. NPDC000188]|uniref:DUF6879 family protein n=1 Tax=unclassified Streptomyces TaxID=2593676 RepID=UPI00333165BF